MIHCESQRECATWEHKLSQHMRREITCWRTMLRTPGGGPLRPVRAEARLALWPYASSPVLLSGCTETCSTSHYVQHCASAHQICFWNLNSRLPTCLTWWKSLISINLLFHHELSFFYNSSPILCTDTPLCMNQDTYVTYLPSYFHLNLIEESRDIINKPLSAQT